MSKHNSAILNLATLVTVLLFASTAMADMDADSPDQDTRLVPDLRDDEVPMKLGKGDFVVVPIPFSNPTLGAGLVIGAGYFHHQTPEQEASQPASVTGVGAMYADSDSYAVGVANSSYWGSNRWRFRGALGYADLELPLFIGELGSSRLELDWQVQGAIAYAQIFRAIGGNWYLGLGGRYMDVDQNLELELQPTGLLLGDTIVASGLGLNLQYDSRDMPSNPYSGSHFNASTLFNRTALGGDDDYDSYALAFSSYHRLADPFVLAWMISGCDRSGKVPLWDACMLNLRGASTTEYMGRSAWMAKVEGRWRLSKYWGLVAFTGAGQITDALFRENNHEIIQNYGAGIRFTVSTKHRINMRLDYGRAENDSAFILSVGEAF
jgi:hypothetical protein